MYDTMSCMIKSSRFVFQNAFKCKGGGQIQNFPIRLKAGKLNPRIYKAYLRLIIMTFLSVLCFWSF